jgi:hypothetical protein
MTRFMRSQDIFNEDKWASIVKMLPIDLEDSAKRCGALIRCIKVPNATALIRLALAYSLSDLSIKDVAAWSKVNGITQITGPGLFYGLRECEPWLEPVLVQMLSHEIVPFHAGLKIRVVDATVITGAGTRGTDWRAHVLINPVSGRFSSVELTDHKGGESYSRYTVNPHDVILADRAYCAARGIEHIVHLGADVVLRVNTYGLKVSDLEKNRVNLLSYESKITSDNFTSLNVLIATPPDMKLRNSHVWNLSEAANWIEARIVGTRTKKGNVIWILTTFKPDQVADEVLLRLYRIRWQIELMFKRLKSLLHLDALPTKRGPTSKTWLLIRFLGAAIAKKMVRPAGPFPLW